MMRYLTKSQRYYMSEYIKRAYYYDNEFCKKVNAMPDDQVKAIYIRIKDRENKKKDSPYQVTIEDWMKGEGKCMN